MRKAVPAVLLGLSYISLPVARSLGRKGVQVFGIDKDKSGIGSKSRYIKFLNSPTDDEDLLKVLLNFADSHDSKVVLFSFNDEYLIFLSRNKDKLSSYFWFPYPNERSLEQLVSKESMWIIFKELGISTPNSIVLKQGSINELENFKLAFPIVIKPNFHEKWLDDPDVTKKIGIRKTLLVNDLQTLKNYHGLLSKYDTIVAQEFIPGKTENLYYYVGYRNIRGQMLVSFVGRKLRTFPDMFGSECFLQSIYHPYLCELGEQILSKLNYVGPAGLDFKFDTRDQSYKLIEINCRLGISDGLLVTCGVDIPYIYYKDVQGITTPSELDYRKNVYWCWFEKDMAWFQEYKSHDGFTKLKWCIHFLFNKYSYAIYAKDDLKPIFYVIGGLVRRLLKNLAGRLS